MCGVFSCGLCICGVVCVSVFVFMLSVTSVNPGVDDNSTCGADLSHKLPSVGELIHFTIQRLNCRCCLIASKIDRADNNNNTQQTTHNT